jgi:hypothetical protein
MVGENTNHRQDPNGGVWKSKLGKKEAEKVFYTLNNKEDSRNKKHFDDLKCKNKNLPKTTQFRIDIGRF